MRSNGNAGCQMDGGERRRRRRASYHKGEEDKHMQP